MKPEHAEFLFSLPLVIHVPSEHFFLVHAGLLPSDLRRPANDVHQPLAHPPLRAAAVAHDDEDEDEDAPIDLSNGDSYDDDADYDFPILDPASLQEVFPQLAALEPDDEVAALRALQERALLHDVPQNRDPWVLLNVRGVRRRGKVTRRGDKGTPWAKLWNGQMRRCGGFQFRNASAAEDRDESDDEGEGGEEGDSRGRGRSGGADSLPCYPSTVVYGHAASRDLDVRRWSVGLDSGCLYGRRLTALVLTRAGHGHGKDTPSPSRTVVRPDDEDDDDDWEEEEDEDDVVEELFIDGDDEYHYAHDVEGASVVGRARRPRSWTRKIRFGDRQAGLAAKLVSVKCPKMADLS